MLPNVASRPSPFTIEGCPEGVIDGLDQGPVRAEKSVLRHVKSFHGSAVGGAIAGMLALSYGFGFMSPSAAKRIADAQTQSAIIATLAPVCAEKFNALPDVAARKAILAQNKDSSWKLREAFPEALVTLPGKSYVDSDLVTACAKLVLSPPKSASLKQ